MSINKHNRDYTGGSPDIPEAVGDVFRGNDLFRDMEYLQLKTGELARDFFGVTDNMLLSGGIVSQGSGDNLDIEKTVAYLKFQVKVPDSYGSNPPTVRTEDTIRRVELPSQTNLSIGSAVLDGVTTNYVKLAVAETDSTTRSRIKGSGTYVYEKTDSYTLTVDDVAPTVYELTLAEFTGSSGGDFTFSNQIFPKTTPMGRELMSATPYENKGNFPKILQFVRSQVLGNTDLTSVFTGRRWSGVAWSPELGLFCVVSFTGTGNRVVTSDNGVLWADQTSAKDVQWYDVEWSPDLTLFVAVSANSAEVMTSPDGINWTLRSAAIESRKVKWSSSLGLFVAVDPGGTNPVQTSPDGINWTQRTLPDQNWNDLVWAEELGLFVAVSSGGTDNVATSPDGINWTLRSLAAGLGTVAWSPELGLLVGGGSFSSDYAISKDGINWTIVSSLAFIPSDSTTWISELGCFIDIGQFTSAISPDGENWIETNWRFKYDLPGNWDAAWSPELGKLVVPMADNNDGYILSTYTTI